MPATANKKTVKTTKTAKKSTTTTKKASNTNKKAAVKATKTAVKKSVSKATKTPATKAKKADTTNTKKTTAKKAVDKKTVAKSVKTTSKKSNKTSVSIIDQVKEEVKEVKKTKKTSSKATKKAEKIENDVVSIAPAVIPDKPDFTAGDFVVYPAHGVGQVESLDIQHVSGIEIALYTIVFEKDRMRLKLPVTKAKASGLRKLSSKDRLKDALSTLQERSQTRRIMWSRRAQEYETKINSGDPVAIAEVLRDLKKDDVDAEQSYSERQIYQAALERLAREVAAIEEIAEDQAVEKLEVVLSKIA